ncbi:MAG: 3-oxoacyl-ACP synthase III family protein [Planctomycetota bacterium]
MRAEPDPHVRITGTGSALPERRVDNDLLATRVSGYDPEVSGPFGRWVDKVTHIHERRFCAPGERTSDYALEAARRALAMAGVEPKDLGLIAYASFTPSQWLPGDHCRLAYELGAHRTANFNLMAACAGSIYGLGLAYGMIASGVCEHVLVVGAETISRVLNFSDPVTAILFGDGAGAVVLSRGDGTGNGGMLPPDLSFAWSPRNIHQANSNVPVDVPVFPDRLQRPGVPLVEQSLVEMEGGPAVLRKAVVEMAASTVRCLGYEPRALKHDDPTLRETLDRAWIVPHQANGRIIDDLCHRLGVRPERAIRTIYRYGNMSAASNLVALDHGIRRGNTYRRLDEDGHVLEIVDAPEDRIQRGDLVLMPSIGGGYLMGCVGFVY